MLETFAVDPGWSANGLGNGGNEYGWLAANHCGGAAGEIGGTFQRSNEPNAFFDGIGPVGAGDCIAAHGRIALNGVENGFNTAIHIGHFTAAGGGGVGFFVAEDGRDTLRVFMIAGGLDELAFVVDASDVAREWSYVYDPASSLMTLELEGYGSLSRPVDTDQAMGIVGLDAFGIHQDAHDNAGDSPGKLEMYLDEIVYTR